MPRIAARKFWSSNLPSSFGSANRPATALGVLSAVERKENVIFLGPSGVSKTHRVIALGYLATQSGVKVRFVSAADLVMQLEKAHQRGQFDHFMRRSPLNEPAA